MWAKKGRRFWMNFSKIIKRIGIFIFLMIFCIYSITAFVKQQIIIHQVKEQQLEVMAQIQKVKEENERLKRLAQYVQTKEYIQKVAREKLGLVGKDEIVFIDKNRKKKE